jgi:hypothetical protein
MKIGPPSGEGKDLRISAFLPTEDGELGILTLEMTWKEWDELEKDAHYFRAYGKVREVKSSHEG